MVTPRSTSPRKKSTMVADDPTTSSTTTISPTAIDIMDAPKKEDLKSNQSKSKDLHETQNNHNNKPKRYRKDRTKSNKCFLIQSVLLFIAGGILVERHVSLYKSVKSISKKAAMAVVECGNATLSEATTTVEESMEDQNESNDDIRDSKLISKPVTVTLDDFPKCHTPNLDRQILYQNVPLPKPIINVGLPKMGTDEQNDFFKCSDQYKTSMYKCKGEKIQLCAGCARNVLGNAKKTPQQEQPKGILASCGNYDVWSHMGATLPSRGLCFMPQMEALEELHQEAPNATLLLPFLDLDTWRKIVFGDLTRRWQLEECKFFPSKTARLQYAKDKRERNKTNNEEQWSGNPSLEDMLELFLCQQVTRVRQFVEKYPSHALVEYDVKAADAGKMLGELFQVPDSCWPRRFAAEA